MTRVVLAAICLSLTYLAAIPLGVTPGDTALSEKQKIEALIEHVERLKDAVFIRNDTEYDAKTAARFLRGKWKTNEKTVKTAKDFIDKVATASSTSGKPYWIRLKDGAKKKSADYLRDELSKLEKKPSKKRSP